MAHLKTSTHFSVDTPSSSTICPNHYHDVFINHRGPDVKNTFATRLYRGLLSHRLQPFLDKDELQKGEYIDPQIEGAIRTASVHIAIFSPGYAESIWCLNELLLILNKCKYGDTIIPIFYKVKPSELRWTTGRYAEALTDHEQKGRYSRQTLDNWRNALKDVSYIVGFELGTYNGNEDKLLEEVVGCVLKKRRKTPLNVADYPTGLQVKVEDFEKTVLSQQQKNGKARVLGIVGLGGAGKTTLAKEIFNRKSSDFNKSLFLYDVRETVRLSSLNSLQSTLLHGLTKKTEKIDSIEKGIEILRERLSSLHALIVLDDVDHADLLRAFLPITEVDVLHSDSLILVTSRNKDVLTRSGIAGSSIYRLTGLNDQHSQQLFCSHAFLQPHPLLGFENLVDEFCKTCDGLPLSLRVFGALLCGKNDQSYWKGQLDKLRQTKLPNEIHKSFQISYDALEEEEERQIFLDIACYFIGEDRDMAIRIWEGSGWQGMVGLLNLQDKCLVEVDENNIIKMHDHLRDLGRQIADQEKSSVVIPHRLWRLTEGIHDLWQQSSENHSNNFKVSLINSINVKLLALFNLTNEQVITKVRGIRTVPRFHLDNMLEELSEEEEESSSKIGESNQKKKKLIDTTPYRFRKLQLVATEGGHLKRILRRVKSPNLIWLRWLNCPYSCLPLWIPMKNIRVLEVTGLKLRTLWPGESQAPLELREMSISGKISEFPKSIGRLKHIEKIAVWCSDIRCLPEEFCHLPSLKYLKLESEYLQSLPDSFGCLTNLQHLDFYGCVRLQGLPDSLRCLTNLRNLNLSECRKMELLPDFFQCLTNLQELSLRALKMKGLPDSFQCLTNLQILCLSECSKLKELPDSFRCLTNLQHLYLFECQSLQRLPDSFGCLTKLQYLGLSGCLQELPYSFGCLTNLQSLRLHECGRLQGLPDSFGCLTNLEKLDIRECTEVEELRELERLISLKKFKAECCSKLKRLQGLGQLTKLRKLRVSDCNALEKLAGVKDLRSLEKLSIANCPKLQLEYTSEEEYSSHYSEYTSEEEYSEYTSEEEYSEYSCSEPSEEECWDSSFSYWDSSFSYSSYSSSEEYQYLSEEYEYSTEEY